MKILFLVSSYYPRPDGVSVVTQYLAEGLAVRHEVLVITERDKGYNEYEVVNNVKIMRIYVQKTWNTFKGEKEKYWKGIKAFMADVMVVVSTQTWTFDWLWKKIDDYGSYVKIFYSHGYSCLPYSGVLEKYNLWEDIKRIDIFRIMNHFYWKMYYGYIYKLIAKYDMSIYLTDKGEDYQYSLKFGLTNGAIMENAIEDFFFQHNKLESPELFEEGIQVKYLCVANYRERKNQKMILEAFYKADIPDAVMIFVGGQKNSYCDELILLNEELNNKYGKRMINILYGLNREQVYNIYDTSHVFIMGSSWEQYPMVLGEAGSMGMAIISTNVGHANALPGCILYETVDELAYNMRYLFFNPQKRKENGKKLRKYCEEHYRITEKIRWFEEEITNIHKSKRDRA